jgi:VWFA-related protein
VKNYQAKWVPLPSLSKFRDVKREIMQNFQDRLRHVTLCYAGLILFPFFMTGIPGAVAQEASPATFKVDVELVTVEVNALDKQGNHVPSLKKEDFQLYEDGKKQEIVSVDEVVEKSDNSSLGMSPLDDGNVPNGKTVLIIFGMGSLDQRQRYQKQIRETVGKYVKLHMKPQDLFAVAVIDSSITIPQNFTRDRDAVLAAVMQSSNKTVNDAGYFQDFLHWLKQINFSLARIKGRKSIVLLTESVFAYSGAGGDIGFLYRDALESMRKSDVVFYTMAPYGSDALQIVTNPSPQVMRGMRDPFNPISLPATTMNLRSLALESGGASLCEHDDDFEAGLEKFNQRAANYYILGYQSSNPKHDGGFRRLKVSTASGVRGITIKHQEEYLDRRPIDILASSRQEKTLMTALASSNTTQQLPIVFRPAYFYESPRLARVLVEARIRAENMVLKKRGERYGTDLDIMGIAYAQDGSIPARFSETVPVNFDGENVSEIKKINFPYRNYFKLRPGKYTLKLAVTDGSNNLGSMEQSIEIPALLEKGLAGSSIVIAEKISPLPGLIQNLQTQLLDDNNPFLSAGVEVQSGAENKMPVGSTIPVLFRLYNVFGGHEQLIAKIKLLNEKGVTFNLPSISLKDNFYSSSPGQGVVSLGISFKSAIPSGRYRLAIEVANPASSQTTTLETDLELIP